MQVIFFQKDYVYLRIDLIHLSVVIPQSLFHSRALYALDLVVSITKLYLLSHALLTRSLREHVGPEFEVGCNLFAMTKW